MQIILKDCLHCGRNFEAEAKEHNRGNAKYCSLQCSSRHYRKNLPPKKPNCSCAMCSKGFYRAKSKQEISKSGLQFCGRKCKDRAQRITGLSDIIPAHYGTTNANTHESYRAKAFRAYPHECTDCGYKKYIEVLQVHHKDGNRSNNRVLNLVILCPTCHVTRHHLARLIRRQGLTE